MIIVAMPLIMSLVYKDLSRTININNSKRNYSSLCGSEVGFADGNIIWARVRKERGPRRKIYGKRDYDSINRG